MTEGALILTQQTKWFEGRHVCVICVARVCARSCHTNVAYPPFRSPPLRSARLYSCFCSGSRVKMCFAGCGLRPKTMFWWSNAPPKTWITGAPRVFLAERLLKKEGPTILNNFWFWCRRASSSKDEPKQQEGAQEPQRAPQKAKKSTKKSGQSNVKGATAQRKNRWLENC